MLDHSKTPSRSRCRDLQIIMYYSLIQVSDVSVLALKDNYSNDTLFSGPIITPKAEPFGSAAPYKPQVMPTPPPVARTLFPRK